MISISTSAVRESLRHVLVAATGTAAISGGVMLASKVVSGERPTVERAMFGGVGLSVAAAGAALLQQSTSKLMGSSARSAPILIAAGVVAGAAGVLAHQATN